MGKRKRGGRIFKGTILAILMLIFGCYGLAYCQDSNAMQSVKNAKIAWESIFPDNKCILFHKNNDKYETHIYEMKSLECDVLKTYSRVNPHKLKVRIEIEKWSIKEKQMSIKDALANVKEKGDRLRGWRFAEFPLTGLYEFEKGRWVFSMGNKWMLDFLKKARAKYNQHVKISTIIFIPEK